MNRRAPHIPLRRPVYIGCEGASEVSYAGLLQDHIRDEDLPIYLMIDELGPGAGDPLSRIEMAVRRLDQLRKKRTAPAQRFALRDSDQADRDPQRDDWARQKAAEHNIVILWQHPCFEAMLLRHLEGRTTHRPPDAPAASKALLREWPDYEKPMSRAALAKRIDRPAVLRPAAVEPELGALLRCIEILKSRGSAPSWQQCASFRSFSGNLNLLDSCHARANRIRRNQNVLADVSTHHVPTPSR